MDLIKLSYVKGRVFCFNGEDYFKIRYNYRVIGSLLGPGVGNSGNRDYKSLPATFTDVEAQFLIEKSFAEVIEKPRMSSVPSAEVKEQFLTEFEHQAAEMKSFETAKSMTVFMENVQKIYEGQVKACARKRQKNEEFKMRSIEELIQDHEKKLASSPLRNRLVHIPSSHPFDVGETIVKNVKAKDEFKYKVYRDLWEQGHTLTCGETFSGDFLCYPGDPLHFHASHIVTIVDKVFTESEMIVHGRTSVSVKKGCIFVKKGSDGEIEYQTIKWVNPEETNNLKIEIL